MPQNGCLFGNLQGRWFSCRTRTVQHRAGRAFQRSCLPQRLSCGEKPKGVSGQTQRKAYGLQRPSARCLRMSRKQPPGNLYSVRARAPDKTIRLLFRADGIVRAQKTSEREGKWRQGPADSFGKLDVWRLPIANGNDDWGTATETARRRRKNHCRASCPGKSGPSILPKKPVVWAALAGVGQSRGRECEKQGTTSKSFIFFPKGLCTRR